MIISSHCKMFDNIFDNNQLKRLENIDCSNYYVMTRNNNFILNKKICDAIVHLVSKTLVLKIVKFLTFILHIMYIHNKKQMLSNYMCVGRGGRTNLGLECFLSTIFGLIYSFGKFSFLGIKLSLNFLFWIWAWNLDIF